MAPALLVLSAIGSTVKPFKQSAIMIINTHTKFVFARSSRATRQINRRAETNGFYDGSLTGSGVYPL
jgi:hypothetical protein